MTPAQRIDMEAGMAKYFASETAVEVATEAMRIHGGYGYSKEYVIERLYRDAPLMCIGEGTNEMQRIIIAKQLVEAESGLMDPQPLERSCASCRSSSMARGLTAPMLLADLGAEVIKIEDPASWRRCLARGWALHARRGGQRVLSRPSIAWQEIRGDSDLKTLKGAQANLRRW
jgi:hypothetical protein